MSKVTQSDLDRWLAAAQAVSDAYTAKNFSDLRNDVLSIEPGRKYAKVVRESYGSRHAFCFIDLATGDILKAASWRAPAKHPRGNIFAPNPTAGIGSYGADYLR